MGILAESNVPEVTLLAGRAPTLAAATVPDEILEPFKFVKFAPDPSVSSKVPVDVGKVTVAIPE